MTPRQFRWLVQTRGPTVAEWPVRERACAFALLRRSPRSRDVLSEALSWGEEEFDAAALARMQRRVRTLVAMRATAAPALRWSVRGGALAACLLAGLWASAVSQAEADGLAAVQVAALDDLP